MTDRDHEVMKEETLREQEKEKLADLPTLEDYRKQITQDKCDCGREGLKNLPINRNAHSGGWPVQGFPELQWLYVTCPKCKYQWALWKLGVPR